MKDDAFVTDGTEIVGYEGDAIHVRILDGVRGIRNKAFSGCSALKSIAIPNSVTWIGVDAFSGCSSLMSIEISGKVTWVGDSAFSGCSSLRHVSMLPGVSLVGRGAFSGCSSLTSMVIPSSVTMFMSDIFRGCSSLVSIEVPNSVNLFGDDIFSDCDKLRTMIVGDKSLCLLRASRNIPNNVTTVNLDTIGSLNYLRLCANSPSNTLPVLPLMLWELILSMTNFSSVRWGSGSQSKDYTTCVNQKDYDALKKIINGVSVDANNDHRSGAVLYCKSKLLRDPVWSDYPDLLNRYQGLVRSDDFLQSVRTFAEKNNSELDIIKTINQAIINIIDACYRAYSDGMPVKFCREVLERVIFNVCRDLKKDNKWRPSLNGFFAHGREVKAYRLGLERVSRPSAVSPSR